MALAAEPAGPPGLAEVVHEPPQHVREVAHVQSMDNFWAMYQRSMKDPEVGVEFSGSLETL